MFTSRSGTAPGRRLCTAAFALVLVAGCGGGGGGGGGSYPPPPPVNLGPLYDFTPIGLPGITYGVVERQGIANGGLVAGTSWDASGNPRAFFFDGKTSIDLGDFGGRGARGFSVNRCRQVTGWAQTPNGIPHAFYYDGTLRDLGTLGGAESWGSVVNTCGKVVGWSTTASGQSHAFYHDGKNMRDLGTFGGTRSEATDVNASGQVVGYAFFPGDARYHAFLYDARSGAPLQDLGSLSLDSYATDINEAGQVAGTSRDADGLLRAFRFDAGALHDLGLPPGGQGSFARAINDAGWVVGYVYYPDGRQNAFLHDGTTLRELAGLPGSRYSDAIAINASGLTVGYALGAGGDPQHATAWGKDYGMVDLNERVKDLPAGTVLQAGLAVADDGAIVVRTNSGLGLLRPRK